PNRRNRPWAKKTYAIEMKDAGTLMEKISSVSPRMYSLMGKYMMKVPNMLVGIPIARSILACEKTRGSSGCRLIWRRLPCTEALAAPAANADPNCAGAIVQTFALVDVGRRWLHQSIQAIEFIRMCLIERSVAAVYFSSKRVAEALCSFVPLWVVDAHTLKFKAPVLQFFEQPDVGQ